MTDTTLVKWHRYQGLGAVSKNPIWLDSKGRARLHPMRKQGKGTLCIEVHAKLTGVQTAGFVFWGIVERIEVAPTTSEDELMQMEDTLCDIAAMRIGVEYRFRSSTTERRKRRREARQQQQQSKT